jgi:hypothetical protein
MLLLIGMEITPVIMNSNSKEINSMIISIPQLLSLLNSSNSQYKNINFSDTYISLKKV